MPGRLALLLFVAICGLLATLLLMEAIGSSMGAVLFAVALAILGGASRGFRIMSP